MQVMPNRAFYWNACVKWWLPKRGCSSSWIAEFSTLWYVSFQPFILLSYNFIQFDEFIFSFYDIYNTCLKEKYGDNPLTHPNLNPDLWLEARSSGRANKNWVYGFSNTTTENLWTTYSVLTVGCSQLVTSTHTPEFEVMLDQRVQHQTSHLNEKYEWFIVDYEEFHQVVMDMRSHMCDPCAPLY